MIGTTIVAPSVLSCCRYGESMTAVVREIAEPQHIVIAGSIHHSILIRMFAMT